MATTPKVLGQSNPSATTETALYTVPAATNAIVSTIVICNQAISSATYRIYVAVAGATTAAKMYISYDVPIGALTTVTMTLGLTLSATDVIRVYTNNGLTSFSAFGTELT